jgi:hypothetical protein
MDAKVVLVSIAFRFAHRKRHFVLPLECILQVTLSLCHAFSQCHALHHDEALRLCG